MNKWIYLTMAYLGNTRAQSKIGKYYLDKSDRNTALKWLNCAAEKKDADSIVALGYCHYLNDDVENALCYYKQAELLGSAEASYYLGSLYFSGNGVSEDRKKAFSYYCLSAARGFPDAIHMLAWCYEHGVGTERDIPRALELWREASEHGIEEAEKALQKYQDIIIEEWEFPVADQEERRMTSCHGK